MKRQKEIKISVIISMLQKQWKQFLIVVLVAAILCGGISYIRDVYALKELNSNVVEEDIEDKEKDETESDLEKDLQDVKKNNVVVTQLYRSFYNELKEYMDGSIIMKMNPSAVYKAEMTYRIQTNEWEKTYSLQKLYGEILGGQELKVWISEKSNIDSLYLDEIISVEKNSDNMLGSDIVSVYIMHYDEEQCQALMNLIHDYVFYNQGVLEEQVGEHEVQEISVIITKVADEGILQRQQNNRSRLSQLWSEVIGRENGFSDEEKAYEEYLLYGTVIEDNLTSEEQDELLQETEVDVKQPGLSVTAIVLGAVLGVISYFAYGVLCYLSNKKVLKNDKFDELYDITHLYSVKNEMSRKSDEVVGAVIELAIKKSKCKNVYLIGCGLAEDSLKQCNEISNVLIERGMTSKVLNNILWDAKAIESLVAAEGVVVFAKTGETTYESIDEVLEFLNKQNVAIIGGININ